MRDQKKEESETIFNNLCMKLWISFKNIPFHFKNCFFSVLLYHCMFDASVLFKGQELFQLFAFFGVQSFWVRSESIDPTLFCFTSQRIK